MNACDLFVVSECMCKAGNAMGTHGMDVFWVHVCVEWCPLIMHGLGLLRGEKWEWMWLNDEGGKVDEWLGSCKGGNACGVHGYVGWIKEWECNLKCMWIMLERRGSHGTKVNGWCVNVVEWLKCKWLMNGSLLMVEIWNDEVECACGCNDGVLHGNDGERMCGCMVVLVMNVNSLFFIFIPLVFNFVHLLGFKHMQSIPISNLLQKAPKGILLHP